LVEQKNHIFIIRLMPRILELSPNIHYVVVGEGDGSLRNELEQLIQSLGVEANVHLLGFRKNVKDYYSFFDVYLMPSLYEGLPFSLIEAQMNGVRVLASDKIAAEAALAPEARFLPLDETLWLQAIEEILAEKSYAEHTVSFDIDNCDYNMHRVASVFEETILDFLRESTDSSKT
jgi:glycosyltransferase involved in cell wall biosynthesis